MKSQYRKPKVFVGLSGGVDSAVSAALLKKAGYEVSGVFIKAWTPAFDSAQGTRKQVCGWKEDRRSAMRVAAVLDIPFITLDLEKEYKKEVVDYMIDEYKKGRTPNPDVMCNKEIKFGHFLKFALDNGADFVATGHYAIRYENYAKAAKSNKNLKLHPQTPSPLQGEGAKEKVILSEGKDKNKDQSYFLWTLKQNQLKHILFPIGHLQKAKVRKLAEKFGLPQATRKDSQGVCFLGKIDMKEFLKEYAGSKKGDVLNENGEKIGEHDGVLLYTIGERHGFYVENKRSKNEPLYVISKDIKNNTITVASQLHFGRPSKMSMKEVLLSNVNLISGKISEKPKENLLCRVRYRQKKIGCKIILQPEFGQSDKKNEAKIIFDEPQMGVASGQSLVLYDGEICLGGGIIS